jgi:hypothetical protein
MGHRFAQDASSTSNIEDAQITKAVGLAGITHEFPASGVPDVRDADGIVFVQPPCHRSGVPPQSGHGFIVRQLPGINCTLARVFHFEGFRKSHPPAHCLRFEGTLSAVGGPSVADRSLGPAQ